MKLLSHTTLYLSILFVSPSLSASDIFNELDNEINKNNQSLTEKRQEFYDYIDNYLSEYESWLTTYNNQLNIKRENLISTWGSAKLNNNIQDVEYLENNTIRKIVNHETNEVTISVIGSEQQTEAQTQVLIKKHITEIAGTPLNFTEVELETPSQLYSIEKEQYEKNAIISLAERQMEEIDIQADILIRSQTGVPESFIYERAYNKKINILAQAKKSVERISLLFQKKRKELGITVTKPTSVTSNAVTQDQLANKPTSIPKKNTIVTEKTEQETLDSLTALDTSKQVVQSPSITKTVTTQPSIIKPQVTSYTIKLPNNALEQRARQFLPQANQASDDWNISTDVIMAIMHSESSFRADAKSHIPAYGLMQIVPYSAGHDVNKRFRNIDKPMTPTELYQPNVNIETGVAYLHLLDNAYLKGITDPKSRLYCMIAAYNTGAGNVARAFNPDRSPNIKKAANIINKMTPKQVFEHLLLHLPYSETKNYLKKVTARVSLYQNKSFSNRT